MEIEQYNRLIQGCENEKLHLSGQIQFFGALIRFERDSKTITHVSENINNYIDKTCEELLGQHFDCIGWSIDNVLDRLPRILGGTAFFPSVVDTKIGKADLFFHSDDAAHILEIELSSLGGCIDDVCSSINFELEDVGKLNTLLVDSISKATSFGRVMLYRFLDDWSGEVTAEKCDDNLDSYLGLRFPASDIPLIARNLYLMNTCRLIPDIDAKSVNILGINNSDIDLTHSDLRSVSPVHLQYLKNMGVAASFSIPIKISGVLWGLVACHNLAPRYLSLEERMNCVSLVQLYVSSLVSAKANKAKNALEQVDKKIKNIFDGVKTRSDVVTLIKQNLHALSPLVDASGIVFVQGNQFYQYGSVPVELELNKINNLFAEQQSVNICADKINEIVYDYTDENSVVSGVFGIKLFSGESENCMLYWFRPEQISEIYWAGEPKKVISEDKNATHLSPRCSFEKFREVKHGHSRRWSPIDKAIVGVIRNFVLQVGEM